MATRWERRAAARLTLMRSAMVEEGGMITENAGNQEPRELCWGFGH